MLKLYKSQLVFFMKTKLDKRIMELVRKRCGFLNGIDVGVYGTRGGICLSWKEDMIINLRSFSSNFIDVLVKGNGGEGDWCFIRFYGSPFVTNRRDSWNELRSLGLNSDLLWLICGDFN